MKKLQRPKNPPYKVDLVRRIKIRVYNTRSIALSFRHSDG